MSKVNILFILVLFTAACTVGPSEINYGKEACHFCKMTIVDNQHAAEIVTAKGKAFKFDAIECMINDLKKRDESEIALFLINDYANPGNLIDARPATYLISEAIPSPMGAFLSGFGSRETALAVKDEKGGEIYDWQAIREQIK